MKKSLIGVVHGRFQVLHNDHMNYILAGRERCRHLVVGITNPDPTLTIDDPADPARGSSRHNPLTYYERLCMVQLALGEIGMDFLDFTIVPFPVNFPHLYRYYVPLDATFYLTIYDRWGEKKLEMFCSQGLSTEVLWRRGIDEKGITGTEVRHRIARGDPWEHLVPKAVWRYIEETGLAQRIRKTSGKDV